MVRTLFEEGLTRPAPYVDHVDRVRELVEPFTPEVAEQVSGIAADDVRRLARELAAAAGGGAAYGRIGVSTTGFGSLAQWGIQCLNILTGHFDQPGGVLFTEPAIDFVARRFVGTGHYDLWRSRVRGVPEYGGELPAAVMREEIETPGEGQIRAMLTIAGNPVLSTPDGTRLGEAFEALDFMAAIDIYVNETTRHADVILPPTTALERDHYDIVFHGLAVRNTARWTPAALPKPEDAKHDWEIYRELALRVQRRLVAAPGPAHPAPAACASGPQPARIIAGLLRTTGVTTLKQLRAHPEGIDLGPLRPTMPERLQTKDHRIDLAPDLVVGDLPRLQAWLDERLAAAPDGPGADRPPAQAGQQRLVPQHRARQPRPAAPPAAHAPRGPRRARHRRRRRWSPSPRASAR